MNQATVERLNRLNRAFYDRHGDEFSDTREGPWPGWERIVDQLPPAADGRTLSVLDVGCGNGRFGRYLTRLGAPFDYTGIDTSERLLEHAAARLNAAEGRRRLARVSLLRLDLLQRSPSSLLASRRYDLVAAFGLTHHLPGFRQRRALLEDLAGLVAAGGLLAVTFWQFAGEERFRRRMAAWEELDAEDSEPLELAELEPGDHLLTWGRRSDAVRYCHHSDGAEIDALTSGLGLEERARYRSAAAIDRFNLYLLLGRARAG